MRYEVPAVILVDAENETEAHTKALELGVTLDSEEGPGAFFLGITTAVVKWPKEAKRGKIGEAPELGDEPLAAHAESLQTASGMQ